MIFKLSSNPGLKSGAIDYIEAPPLLMLFGMVEIYLAPFPPGRVGDGPEP
jgi:hypothetical protein